MLTIWGRLNSHNVKKVVWAAVETGQEWVRHDIGGSFGYSPEYLAMNPNRLVPTLVEDDFSLWESNAILRYLADAHAPHLWPQGLRARALADKWMDWQFAFADAQRDGFLQMVRVAEADRDTARIERSIAETNKLMLIMEETLAKQPFLTGEAFGIADIPMGAYAYTWFKLDFAQADVPNIRRWFESVSARPGFQYVAIPLT
ncbi:glutathione S-transferase family protein [Novosphingobium sediminicola]|uniref:Glutathione S-transferase n=1 Tax=Novosphingobium sediminicola TaxID=563162 RepID=A0A7W6G4X5_9SPHN|nr:glutathione S-transferase family protein [Novosphingobium sediminicola]MBB3953455.1 glutathione S-transferase [Novosphingobium sediminicola]